MGAKDTIILTDSFFFVIVKQALVAGSTWVIADIGKKMATQQPVIFEVIGYCTLFLIVYLPGIARFVCQQKGITDSNNVDVMDGLLDKLAKERLIIEIRHGV